MKTIDLASNSATREEIFQLAERQGVFVRTADGKLFIVAEIEDEDVADDFADEVARTRKNTALRELLVERSREPGILTIDEVREKLGLSS